MKTIFIYILVIIFTSCSTKNKNTTTYDPLKRVWMMTEFQSFSKQYLFEKKASLSLTDRESASASMGCNDMSFPYKVSNKNSIQFFGGISTRMYCNDMTLEREFSKAIVKVKKYSISGHQLTLIAEDGSKMIFIAQDWD
jgi:heat shock protein HslJ